MICVICDLNFFIGNAASVGKKAKLVSKPKPQKAAAAPALASNRKSNVAKKSAAAGGGTLCENVCLNYN